VTKTTSNYGEKAKYSKSDFIDCCNARYSVLVGLLRTSEDPIVLSVAAHDLGQYVKYAEGGKK
jgi:hypothetical protein